MSELVVYYAPNSYTTAGKVDIVNPHNIIIAKKGVEVKGYVFRGNLVIPEENISKIFFDTVFSKYPAYSDISTLVYENVSLLKIECMICGNASIGFIDDINTLTDYYWKYCSKENNAQLLTLLNNVITYDDFINRATNNKFDNFIFTKFPWFCYLYLVCYKKSDISSSKYISGLMYILKDVVNVRNMFRMEGFNIENEMITFIVRYLHEFVKPELFINKRIDRIFKYVLNNKNFEEDLSGFIDKLVNEIYIGNKSKIINNVAPPPPTVPPPPPPMTDSEYRISHKAPSPPINEDKCKSECKGECKSGVCQNRMCKSECKGGVCQNRMCKNGMCSTCPCKNNINSNTDVSIPMNWINSQYINSCQYPYCRPCVPTPFSMQGYVSPQLLYYGTQF